MKKLNTRIMLAILLCAGLSVLLVVLLGYRELSQMVQRDAAEALSWMARGYAAQFSQEIRLIENKAQDLYQRVYSTVDVEALQEDPDYLPAYSQSLEGFFEDYATNYTQSISAYCYFNPELSEQPYDIYYVDGNGDRLPERQAHIPLDYYDGIPQPNDDKYWWYGPVESKGLVWTNPYQWTLINGEVIEVVSCAKPVYVEDTLVAVVGLYYRLDAIQEAIDNIEVYETGYAALFNEKLDVILHPTYQPGNRNTADNLTTVENGQYGALGQAMLEQPCGSRSYNLNGQWHTTAFAQLSNGWRMSFTAANREIYASAYDLFPKLLGVVALCGLLAVVVARLLSRMLVSPILRVVDAAREIGQGNFGVQLDLQSSDEINALGEAVNEMVFNIHRLNNELISVAYYDPLTGMGNSHYFEKTVGELLMQEEPLPRVYIVMDIGKFKLINDIFGTEEGNRLLQHMAVSIGHATRQGEVCARFNSDHFHVLWRLESRTEIETRLRELYDRIVEFSFQESPAYKLTVAFGAYLLEGDCGSVSLMGDRASLALASAKGSHTFSLHFYNDNLMNKILEEQEIENTMEAALQQGQFQVYLQPQYDPYNVSIIGLEALVRWVHPTKGVIAPMDFIPLFERNGFIAELDRYMLDQVCQLLRRWMDDGIAPLQISVNQSRKYLSSHDYISGLLQTVDRYHLPRHLVELEITETAFFEDQEEMIRIVTHLHELGFVVSMDDFGSGYSSLNMLQDIMVDVLKIDKNFFRDSINNDRGKRIVANIISMAQELRIVVVAEGIETTEQVDFLKRCSVDLIQGYYYARPMPLEEVDRMVRSNVDRVPLP